MPNAVCDTGNGGTATFSTTAFTSNVMSIDTGEETITDVSKDHLGSTVKQYVPGDLKEYGEVVIPYQFDNEAPEIIAGVVETLTITFPLALKSPGTPQTTNATYAGSGYIKSVKRPTLANDTLQEGSITWKWDGDTGPVYTAGS